MSGEIAIAYEKSQKPDSSRITSKLDAARTLERDCIGALGSKICKVPQKSSCGKFHHIDALVATNFQNWRVGSRMRCFMRTAPLLRAPSVILGGRASALPTIDPCFQSVRDAWRGICMQL